MRKSLEVVDLEGILLTESNAAWKFADGTTRMIRSPMTGDDMEQLISWWLPKSLCDWAPIGDKLDGHPAGIMTLPRWLAEEKGLI
jgi:hypothetical protein